jgi:hypothetical protein
LTDARRPNNLRRLPGLVALLGGGAVADPAAGTPRRRPRWGHHGRQRWRCRPGAGTWCGWRSFRINVTVGDIASRALSRLCARLGPAAPLCTVLVDLITARWPMVRTRASRPGRRRQCAARAREQAVRRHREHAAAAKFVDDRLGQLRDHAPLNVTDKTGPGQQQRHAQTGPYRCSDAAMPSCPPTECSAGCFTAVVVHQVDVA